MNRSPSLIQSESSPTCSSRRAAAPAIVAALVALALYAVTLGGTYVFDDVILHEDARFTHPAQWSKFWTQAYMPDAVDQLYRPLTCLTFAMQYSLHGDRPWLYHLVNWLLHAGAAAAVAELARRLMGFRVAIAAGVLFAVHPVHVEAVAGLVGRAELLCALATFIALNLFLKPMTLIRRVLICICFAVAILSKEQGILLPAFLLALIPFRNQSLRLSQSSNIHSTSDSPKSDRGAMGMLFCAVCLLTAGYLIFREELLGFGWDRQKLDWAANPLIRSTSMDRVLMPVVLLGRYLGLLVSPMKLSLDYGSHVIGSNVNWNQPWFYLGAIALAGAIAGLLLAWRNRNWFMLFCLLGLGISYGMVSNSFILIGTIFAERLMYLPSAFFLILTAALLAKISGVPFDAEKMRTYLDKSEVRPRFYRSGWAGGGLFAVVVTVIALAGSVRTFSYARLWNDPLQLCLYDLREYPASVKLHGLVVDQYIARGDYRAARAVAEDALRTLPDCEESYRLCVNADVRLNDFADAERVLAHPDPRCAPLKMLMLRDGLEALRKERGY